MGWSPNTVINNNNFSRSKQNNGPKSIKFWNGLPRSVLQNSELDTLPRPSTDSPLEGRRSGMCETHLTFRKKGDEFLERK